MRTVPRVVYLGRRVRRAISSEGRLTGHKAGRRLSAIFPTEGRESWSTKVRRFIRESYQTEARNKLGLKAGPGVL